MDLRPVMNPTPSTILASTPLPQIFRSFRALGLVRFNLNFVFAYHDLSAPHGCGRRHERGGGTGHKERLGQVQGGSPWQ